MKSGQDSIAFKSELIISDVLRWGVMLSLVLLSLGTLLCFVHSHDYGAAGGNMSDLDRLLTQEEPFPRTLHWWWTSLGHFEGQGFIVTGLVLLIATPILRVAISIVAFIFEKDRAYVVITTIVFLLLMVSLLLGKAG